MKHKYLWHEPVSIQLVGQLASTQNSLTPGFVKGFRAKRPLTKEEDVELQYIKLIVTSTAVLFDLEI